LWQPVSREASSPRERRDVGEERLELHRRGDLGDHVRRPTRDIAVRVPRPGRDEAPREAAATGARGERWGGWGRLEQPQRQRDHDQRHPDEQRENNPEPERL